MSTETQTPIFKHTPLDHNEPTIRLVRIHRKRVEDEFIECDILLGSVCDSYTCLSYRWGNVVEPTFPTKLNGGAYAVHQNLYDFLMRMATTLTTAVSGLYWIDALCIDQANTLERNHQVGHMGQIFSLAQAVHIWLGVMPELIPTFKVMRRLIDLNYAFFAIEYRDQADKSVLRRKLTENEYWNRAWVTQEIVLADTLMIVTDHDMFSFQAMMNCLWCFSLSYDQTSFALFAEPNSQLSSRNDWLMSLLSRFRARDCHEPRDLIFSLLSLCRERRQVKVNYQLSEVDLAHSILNDCATSTCLCSALLVGHCLKLNGHSKPTSTHKHTPYLEFDLPDPFVPYVPQSDPRLGQVYMLDQDYFNNVCPCMSSAVKRSRTSSIWGTHHKQADSPQDLVETAAWAARRSQFPWAILLPARGVTFRARCPGSGTTVRIELWALPYVYGRVVKLCARAALPKTAVHRSLMLGLRLGT